MKSPPENSRVPLVLCCVLQGHTFVVNCFYIKEKHSNDVRFYPDKGLPLVLRRISRISQVPKIEKFSYFAVVKGYI